MYKSKKYDKFLISKNLQNKAINRHIVNIIFLEHKIVKSGSYATHTYINT